VSLLSVLATGVAIAQESGDRPTPAPMSPSGAAPPAAASASPIDAEYDGKTHLTFTPYVWLPTVNGTFAFTVPALPHHGGGTTILNAQVGPNGYLAKLNFAIMGAFDLRKGNVAAFGDFINLNVSSGRTFVSSVSGPLGKVQIPVDAGSSGRIASTIWELGAGYTLAHGRDASLEFVSGWRQATVKGTLDWNVSIGKNGLIARSGSAFRGDTLSDVIFGLRGKVALGDSGWFVPYYADIGAGANNSSTQEYIGVGRAFRTGSVLLLFRNLAYSLPAGSSYVQSIRFGGPLVGYTFKL
ncbi:MAG: hypothetical protein ABI231_12105, partial [Candidatus Tumulicola sp.]